MKGNPEPVKELYSHREDVTLANPLGPPAHGWDEVAATIEHAASQFRDGRLVGVEIVEKNVTPEVAYTLWLEHGEGKVGGREDVAPATLRVTMIYRPEEGLGLRAHPGAARGEGLQVNALLRRTVRGFGGAGGVVRADGALGDARELLRTPCRRRSGRSAEAKLAATPAAMPKSASSRSYGLIAKKYVLPGGCGARSAGRILRPVLRQREGRGSTTDGSKLPAPPRRGEGRTRHPSSSPRRLPYPRRATGTLGRSTKRRICQVATSLGMNFLENAV